MTCFLFQSKLLMVNTQFVLQQKSQWIMSQAIIAWHAKPDTLTEAVAKDKLWLILFLHTLPVWGIYSSRSLLIIVLGSRYSKDTQLEPAETWWLGRNLVTAKALEPRWGLFHPLSCFCTLIDYQSAQAAKEWEAEKWACHPCFRFRLPVILWQ